MKYFLTSIFVFPIIAYGQIISNETKLTVYDTVAIIETQGIEDKEIEINTLGYTLFFDKPSTIISIGSLMQEIRKQEVIKDWQHSTVEELEQVSFFVSSQNLIIWDDFWNNNSTTSPVNQRGEFLTRKYFVEIACSMLEKGQFELIVGSEKQERIYKTNSSINGAYATVYVTQDQKPLWVCPPITMD